MCRGGRAIHIPSNAYRAWHKDASRQLTEQSFSKLPIETSCVDITLFAPDRRAGDLSNKAESIMDLLTDNGIIKDDNWFVIPNLSLHFGGVEKDNPRVEINI